MAVAGQTCTNANLPVAPILRDYYCVQAGGAVYTINNEEVAAGEVDKLAQTLLKVVTDVRMAFLADIGLLWYVSMRICKRISASPGGAYACAFLQD